MWFAVPRWQAWLTGVAMSVLFAAGGGAQELGQWSFADGAQDWTASGNATVVDVARRPGGKSLLLRQTKDEEASSAWLSPVLKSPGPAVQVSLWAADNYATQKDASYAAAFEVVPCDADGKLTGTGGDWTYLPWEDKRQIPAFHHTLTREGLKWTYYSAVKRTGGGTFRVRLCWPKALLRGECYFTDVRVTAAAATVPATGPAAPAATSRFALELSNAASGNLFYADDPFRWEFLLYATDGQPVGPLTEPVIRYDITDFEHFQVAAGTLPFAGAAPVVHKALAQDKARNRTQNLRLSALLPDAAAREVGREFFLHAALVAGGQVLAEDTVTYAVVNPRPPPTTDFSKCRFVSFADGTGFRNPESKHEHQSLLAKTGAALTQTWDYGGWRKAQPTRDAPLTIAPDPAFPKLVYCPNLEQIRGRKPGHPWGDMGRYAPDWALLDDPAYPGCKTFDIDGYVAYQVAYVRANRARIVQVVPSGLERPIDARTLELQRKAYAALKREFPDLPVGMMTWGVNASDEQVDLVLREKLYEVADFFDTHVYLAGIDWGGAERLRKELQKLGHERRMISTEFARVGGTDQLQGSRDLITAMLDAHAHAMDRITYFLMYVGQGQEPALRQPVLRGEFPGDGFQWMQYADRPRVADAITDPNWGRGSYGTDQRGASLMPLLKTTTYCNFVQAVEGADFKTVFAPTPRSIAYVYARDGQTICYVFLREPDAPTLLTLATDVPYTQQDLYGRTDRVTPAGAALFVATLDPLLLVFERAVPALHDAKTAAAALRPAAGGLTLPVVARGAAGTATLTLPPGFARAFSARVVATVDGTWPQVAPQTVALTPAQPATVTLPLAIAADRAAGSYTFTTRLYDGATLVAALKQPLTVGERLTAQMRGVPMTAAQDPAIAVTLHSLADQPLAGTVRLANRYFGAGFEPAQYEQPYTVPARGTAELRFPVPRAQASLAISYELRATLADQSGFTITCEDDVSFQACVKTKKPIVVDGDLGDWQLDALVPIPFEKWHRGPRDAQEFSGRFYSRWDEAKLYFAAEITDHTPVANGTDQVHWNDDNIMLCLYPWGWHMGEPLNGGYYREHIGPLQGGKASVLRVGNVPSGPPTPAGVEVAVRRTATAWVYEWAYPRATIHPMALAPGGAFRLSLSVWDQFKRDKKGEGDWGQYTWLTFSGFNTSVNAVPSLWRQFNLIE